MNTRQFLDEVSRRMGCYKKDARELILQHVRDALLEAARRGEKVRLHGFGVFVPVRGRRSRKTGQKKLTLRFRPAAEFLRELNDAKEVSGDAQRRGEN